MRKIFLKFVVAFIISSPVMCQTIDKLDEKNGYKDFKLGDSYSKWENQLKYEGDYDDGSKAYSYQGECCKKIFEYNIEEIILRFSNNKLVIIDITTEKFQKEYNISGKYTDWRAVDFESINSSFSIIFGKPTQVEMSKDTGEVIHIWAGKKVMLISRYENLGYKSGDRQIITIIDINELKKNVNGGF